MRTKVMLVDETRERVEWIRQALEQAGFEVVSTIQGMDDLYQQVVDLEPDVVIVEACSGKRDVLEHLGNRHQRYPKPVIMLTGGNDPEIVRTAAQAGVSAYAVQGLSADGVRSIIDVAISQFKEYQQLQARVDTAEAGLSDRKHLERAKGLLMERHHISENDAYHLLRKAAMERNSKVADVARALLKVNGHSS